MPWRQAIVRSGHVQVVSLMYVIMLMTTWLSMDNAHGTDNLNQFGTVFLPMANIYWICPTVGCPSLGITNDMTLVRYKSLRDPVSQSLEKASPPETAGEGSHIHSQRSRLS